MKPLLLIPFLAFPLVLAAQDCPTFNGPAGKAVKVTVFTETDQCFSLSVDGSALNPSPAKRVTYTMEYGTTKAKVKLSNGTELEKAVMVTNTAMASVVYEVVFNDKKKTYDLKNRLMQGDVTEEQHQANNAAHQANVADQKAKQEASDKEWEEKRAAEKARLEAERANDQPKYTIQPVDTKVNTDIQKVDTKVNTDIQKVDTKLGESPSSASGSASAGAGSSGASASAGAGSGSGAAAVTKGKFIYEIQVMAKGQPVAGNYVTMFVKDFNYGTCLTDKEGYCKLEAVEEISCQYPIGLKGEKTSSAGGGDASANATSKWSVEGVFVISCDKGTLFKLEQAAEAMSHMSGMSADRILAGWGF